MLLTVSILLFVFKTYAQTFTPGNLAVLVAASASANNTTASIAELTTTTPNQTAPVNTYSINGTTGSNALRFSGSATSTGYLSNSNDKSLLAFTGGNTTASTSNINTITLRGVGTVNASGTYNLATTYTSASGNQARSATSLDNSAWFIADQGGIYTNGSTAPSPSGNIRSIKAFAGTVYASSASSSVIQVNTISSPAGSTLVPLPGLTNNASFQDFYLIQSGANGAIYDVLYVLSATSNTVGSISKYSLVSGTWTANGSYTTTFGGFGLAAQANGTGANLYLSTGMGALAANNVLKLADAAGFNATISITTPNNIILYTTPAGTTIKGVAFAPVPGSAATDQFRSITSGFWSSPSTWESSSDNFVTTISPATISPTAVADTVIIRNSHTVTVNANVTIDQTSVQPLGAVVVATPATLTIAAGGYLTLKSDATGTARIGNSTGTISGNTIVERFIPARRAWRLLSAPLTTSSIQTVRAAWQEGGATTSGFGTQITGGTTAAGFDQSPGNTASIKMFDQIANVFNPLPSTLTPITSQPGYFLFVRGDRTIDLAQGAAALPTNTILRTTGTLKTGDTTINISATNFSLLGNPYASPIDFSALNRTGVINRFYAWDPTLNAVGGYVTVDDATNTGAYSISPNYSSQTKVLQSGQAFFVQPNAGSAFVTFTESSKSAATSNVGFRTNDGSSERFRANIYLKNTDNTTTIADGVLAEFNTNFSSEVLFEDAPKMGNINENLALQRNGHTLSIERRPLVDGNDTLFLNFSNTTSRSYTFKFEPSNISSTVSVWLEDSYLRTSTPLSVTAPSTVDFSVASGTASADANRFRIIFKTSGALPVSAINVKAYQQNAGIQVDWNVATESNMSRYEVEKSADGQTFAKVGTAAATGNNNAAASYNWFDATPFAGSNFYRIKATGKSGEITFSQIVNVKVGNGKSDIVVYPNPVHDKVITLQFSNEPKGTYTVQLFNALGQQLLTKTLEHFGGSATQTIQLNTLVSKGVYQLQVSNGDNKVNQQIIVQ